MRRDAFVDRAAAGRALAAALEKLDLIAPVVLALPRGGVVVAAEVARVLDAPLDVLVVRKIGHPRQPELGLGAVAEDGEPVFDEQGLRYAGLTPEALSEVVAREQLECRRRVDAYRRGRAGPVVLGRDVVLVDDGIATGVTATAGLRLLRQRGPSRLVLAAPVGARDAVQQLSSVADDTVVLLSPRRFGAVSQFYEHFGQTGDDEVVRLLRR